MREEILSLLTKKELATAKRIANGKAEIDNHLDLYNKLFDYYVFETDEMPYGTAKARTGDPMDWITDQIVREFE